MSAACDNSILYFPKRSFREKRCPITDKPLSDRATLILVTPELVAEALSFSQALEFIYERLSNRRYSPAVSEGHNPLDMTDYERDERAGDQWILSVIAYLEWREGKSWRRLTKLLERWNPLRWHYLEPQRLLKELRYANASECTCAKFCAHPPKKPVASASAAMWAKGQSAQE